MIQCRAIWISPFICFSFVRSSSRTVASSLINIYSRLVLWTKNYISFFCRIIQHHSWCCKMSATLKLKSVIELTKKMKRDRDTEKKMFHFHTYDVVRCSGGQAALTQEQKQWYNYLSWTLTRAAVTICLLFGHKHYWIRMHVWILKRLNWRLDTE